jgi:ankyrin repeat protein
MASAASAGVALAPRRGTRAAFIALKAFRQQSSTCRASRSLKDHSMQAAIPASSSSSSSSHPNAAHAPAPSSAFAYPSVPRLASRTGTALLFGDKTDEYDGLNVSQGDAAGQHSQPRLAGGAVTTRHTAGRRGNRELPDAANTFLHAAHAGDIDTINRLLSADHGRACLTARNAARNSTLIVAAFAGNAAVVDRLLQEAAKFGLTNMMLAAVNDSGWNALHIAAQKGNTAIVDHLLSAGLAKEQLIARDKNGVSALMVAAITGHAAVVERLLPEAAKLGLIHTMLAAIDHDGNNALSLAQRAGHAAIVEKLQAAANAGSQPGQ